MFTCGTKVNRIQKENLLPEAQHFLHLESAVAAAAAVERSTKNQSILTKEIVNTLALFTNQLARTADCPRASAPPTGSPSVDQLVGSVSVVSCAPIFPCVTTEKHNV
ncbi:hypothetical protein Trydic_g871 [Trypoxylus dichotomus]